MKCPYRYGYLSVGLSGLRHFRLDEMDHNSSRPSLICIYSFVIITLRAHTTWRREVPNEKKV